MILFLPIGFGQFLVRAQIEVNRRNALRTGFKAQIKQNPSWFEQEVKRHGSAEAAVNAYYPPLAIADVVEDALTTQMI